MEEINQSLRLAKGEGEAGANSLVAAKLKEFEVRRCFFSV